MIIWFSYKFFLPNDHLVDFRGQKASNAGADAVFTRLASIPPEKPQNTFLLFLPNKKIRKQWKYRGNTMKIHTAGETTKYFPPFCKNKIYKILNTTNVLLLHFYQILIYFNLIKI